MAATVTLFPIGYVEEDVLADLARRIARRCALACHQGRALDHPAAAFDKNRRQYDARMILNQLQGSHPPAGHKHLGVTHVDLFVPILTFVFGLSRINHACALVSLHRLRPQFHQKTQNIGLMLDRLEKTAIHEIGHAFGLTHCLEQGCVMFAATRIDDTDAKSPDFCTLCRDVFQWRTSVPVADRP